MKIASGGIQHETNTFSKTPTRLDDFVRDSDCGPQLSGGQTLVDRMKGTGTIHGGYLAGAAAEGIELLPLLSTRAQPSGRVDQRDFETMSGWFLERLSDALPVDGLLLDLHGAMATSAHDDAEGEFITKVRELVGADLPIVTTLDLHANITGRMAALSDVIIGFDTYPHVDMRERGEEAVRLLSRIVRGEVHPAQAYRQLPLLTMPPMQCTLREPMQSLMVQLHQLEREPQVLTATIAMGFPFADIHDAGVSVLVTTDGDDPLAQRKANELAARVWGLRDDLQPRLTTIEAAIEHVRQHAPTKPVLFADGSDNPGGGAPCDGTVALAAIIQSGLPRAAVGVIHDPETARQAHEAGPGSTIQVRLGAKSDRLHGETLHVEAEVRHLCDGEFRYGGAMMQGLADSLGPTATLRIGGVDVVVSSVRRQCLDAAMLRVAGVEPTEYQLIVVKSAVHFRADLGPLASTIFDADTPGIHRPDFAAFQYERLRRPLYPLDRDTHWTPE